MCKWYWCEELQRSSWRSTSTTCLGVCLGCVQTPIKLAIGCLLWIACAAGLCLCTPTRWAFGATFEGAPGLKLIRRNFRWLRLDRGEKCWAWWWDHLSSSLSLLPVGIRFWQLCVWARRLWCRPSCCGGFVPTATAALSRLEWKI